MKFKVNEVFHSIQGEGARIGRPCLFIRLTGCPLRCIYCDTDTPSTTARCASWNLY